MLAAFLITWVAMAVAILLSKFIDMRRRMRVRLGELPKSTPHVTTTFPSGIDIFYIFSPDFAKVDNLSPWLLWPLRGALAVVILGMATMIGWELWSVLI